MLEPLADFRERLLFIRGLYNAEALKGNIHSSQTGNLLSGAPLASGGEIRSGTSFDQVLAQHVRPSDEGAEPGPRLREVEPVGAQELFDAVQLPHLVELPHHADAAGALPRAGLRPPVQGRAPSGGPERARFGPGRRARPPPIRSASPIGASSTSTSTRSARSRRGSSRPASRGELQGWRPTLDEPEHPAAGGRHPAGHRRAHAVDGRHPGARLPDRHDAASAR